MGYSLGIISSDYLPNAKREDRCSYVNTRIKEEADKIFDEVLEIDPSSTYIDLNNNKATVIYWFNDNEGNERQIDLTDLDAILIKRTRDFGEQIYDLITVLSSNSKLKIFDPPNSFFRPLTKITSKMLRFRLIPQAHTIVINSTNLPKYPLIKFPVYVKPTHGYRGLNTERCSTLEELESYLRSEKFGEFGYGAIVEEDLDNTEEYRVIVVGGVGIGCVIKFNPDKVVKNYAQGSEFIERRIPEVKQLAEESASAQRLSFAGVDIVRVDGELYVLECNRNPDFKGFDNATKLNTARILNEYIHKKIAGKKDVAVEASPALEPMDSQKTGNTFIVGTVNGVIGELVGSTLSVTNATNIDKTINNIQKELTLDTNDLANLKELLLKSPEREPSGGFSKGISQWMAEVLSKAATGIYGKTVEQAASILVSAITKYYTG